jgi:exopolysaccharide/PEP-CTERM locus tyrosine autokinase
MSESIGLIERAAALLREREARDVERPPPVALAKPESNEPELILDPVRLARFGIALPSERRSRVVEEFRLVKRNLITLWSQEGRAGERRGRTIMVTSARPAEGKTFVAINLALAFAAEADGEALLIDADTEHPMLPLLSDVAMDRGIVDYLSGQRDLADVSLRTSLPKLTVIPCGSGGPHVPELFSGKRMLALLSQLNDRSRDRVTIIDTPPCLVTSEAAALAPHVSQVVVVVEAHRTQYSEIESCLSLLSGCANISLLLNKSDASPNSYFSEYGYYYYYGKKEDESPADVRS